MEQWHFVDGGCVHLTPTLLGFAVENAPDSHPENFHSDHSTSDY